MAKIKENKGIRITENYIDFEIENYWLIVKIFGQKMIEVRGQAKEKETYRVKWEINKVEKLL